MADHYVLRDMKSRPLHRRSIYSHNIGSRIGEAAENLMAEQCILRNTKLEPLSALYALARHSLKDWTEAKEVL